MKEQIMADYNRFFATGKGDHRHIGEKEEPYIFKDAETLVYDFLEDIARERNE